MPKKVLLIEYEPRYIERIRTLLSPLGHTLTEAHDGEAGLQAFGTSKFDVVLLSGMLPRLPSAEVIREIRKKGGATAPPILLMMSGYRGTNRKADAQKVGAFDILARPFNDEDLVGSVRDALESSDIGAKTMRIDTTQLAAAASPLTSNDIFSDVLSDLTDDAGPKPAAAPNRHRHRHRHPRRFRPSGLRRLRRAARAGRWRKRHGQASSRHAVRPESRLPARRRAEGRLRRPRSRFPCRSPPLPLRSPSSRPTPTSTGSSPTRSRASRSRRPRPPAGATPPPRRNLRPAAGLRASPRGARGRRAGLGAGPLRPVRDHREDRERRHGGAHKARRTGVEGFQKIVAIKKILPHIADDEEFVTMFADEAKLAAQLNHPNIIHIYDLGKIQAGGYFIAMEHVDGRDLRSIEQSAREHSAAAAGPARRVRRVQGRLGPRLRAPAPGRRRARAQHRAPRRVASEHPHLLRGRHQALRLRDREGGLESVARRSPARSRARSSTCRPSRRGASPSTGGAISSRSASCSTSSSRASASSAATRTSAFSRRSVPPT